MLLLAILAMLHAPGHADDAPTDYEIELRKIEKNIAELAGGAFAEPVDVRKVPRLVALVYQRSSLTASFADFRAAENVIDAAFEKIGPSPDLYLLKANLEFKLHRLANAKASLARVEEVAEGPSIQALRADIALQEGRYEEARKGYERVLREGRTWDSLARLAYLESKTGNVSGAEKLYVEAQKEITAKEMRSYAWVELQRGLLDLDRGRYEKALAHYRRADQAYSGYWLIEEHIAEGLDLLGRTDEALELYRRVVEQTGNPEYLSALAGIVGRKDALAAEALEEEAQRGFEERYRLYPEAALGHFLEHLLARKKASPELLALAAENHRLRPNAESKLLLAKAYLKLNKVQEANCLLQEILRTPWRTPEIARISQQVRGKRPPRP